MKSSLTAAPLSFFIVTGNSDKVLTTDMNSPSPTMLNYLWCSFKWLFADPFVPGDEMELIEIAEKYSFNFKKYRYFLDYEKKIGIEAVRGFWYSALPWVKDHEEDNDGNWVPVESENYHSYVGDSALAYYSADAMCRKVFSIEIKTLRFSNALDHEVRLQIIEHVKTHWINGSIV